MEDESNVPVEERKGRCTGRMGWPDLIARSKKYAKGAGRIQEGQRRAAEKDERLSRWLSGLSTALSAIVGTSIFAQWIHSNPIPFGLAAIVAAGLTAVQRTSRLDERAEAHRLAGAEYGGLRRRTDMLRLRLEAGDIEREKGLLELEQIGEDLSRLAKKTRTLPDRIYKSAAEAFRKTHPEYFTDSPTHAGGVVIRREGDGVQNLVVQAKKGPHEWVLPKGHIDPGESLEQAARREVLEEAGIEAAVRDVLDTVEFSTPNERVNARFFLMEAIGEGPPREGRERKWLNFNEAMQTVRFKEAQMLLGQAYALLQNKPN